MLFTRDEGAAEILVNAAPGTYDVQVWSIPASPANPSRVHTVSTLTVDGEQQEPTLIDTPLMLDLLASFGPCSGGCAFDLDANGSVDMSDLLLLLGNWGEPWEG